MNAARTAEPIRIADLFSGCGGFTQAFHAFRPEGREGDGPVFSSVLAIEKEPWAAATYAANFAPGADRSHVHTGEIEHWTPSDEEISADVALGGPPCQGFSQLGKMNPSDPRNKLWRHYVRLVAGVIRPKIFIIENVQRFVRSPEFEDLQEEMREGGELSDYRLVLPPGAQRSDSPEQRAKRYLLNAADYGVPQERIRAIVIGVRKDVPELEGFAYPEPTHQRPRDPAQGDGATAGQAIFDGPTSTRLPWRTVEEVFKTSAAVPLADGLPPKAPGPSGWPEYVTSELHVRRNPDTTSLARYKAIPPGGNRKNLVGVFYKVDRNGNIRLSTEKGYGKVRGPETYLSTTSWDRHRTGTGDVMGRLLKNKPSVTIRTEFYKPEKGRYLHPEEDRPLTLFEGALIQGFPKTFKWCGSKTQIGVQIGNAVPIGLGTALARVVYEALAGGSRPS
ncbi:DNA cytosine methyltransferase [Streptomyces sp. enrichment culture]|uniref:DNA cytosine methyltransferase n=1 Tax=Streptomyces sp. enrichment culture TaxID=1795815 RepID=UPI003F555420